MPASSLPRRARYERGAARVLAPDGEPVGAGFLLDDDLLCTCAHVVAAPDGSRPSQPVEVDFPLLAGAEPGPRVPAVVENWWPEDDIAHLRLTTTVDGTEPLPLADGTENEWNREIRAFGFPPKVSRGVNATGTMRGRQRADLIQLDLTAHGVRIGPGFSGAAVWDPQEEAVVGMLTTRGRGPIGDTAYLLAADRLTDPDALPCPFRGLARFESEHARYFHGRDDEVGKLVRALETRPLTVLVGPSGSGKSSLLRAGLLAAVRKRGTPWALRVPEPADPAGTSAGDADAWVAEAVTAAWHDAVPDEAARRDRFEAVRAACAGDEAGRRVLRGRLTHELGPPGAVLLLDQFEEYAVASPPGALRAFRALSALAQAPDPAQGGGLRVVLTARSATLEALTAADTSARLDGAVQFLAPMTAEALTRAVEEPVRAVAGLRLEEGLARRLVSDAVDEPGCLPLLQFALTRLWEQRKAHTMTHAAYERTGGVVKALAEYANDALRDCLASTGVPEDAARRLFQQLARPDGQGGFTRRAAPIRQLSPEQAALARALAGRRLLVWDVVERPDPSARAGTVQVVHEALLREWERPAAWLHEGADFLEWHERTARDAAEWDGAGRPDGLLPHGARLAQGLQWLVQRPDDLTGTERAYLEAGRRRQRRGLRRLWGVTALVTVLAVLASTLAVSTYRALQRDRAQLRTAAAAELGTLAADVADRSPDSAFRYAAGAWSARPTPQARQALLGQYVRAADVTSAHSGLWPGTAQWTSMSPDGRTMVVLSRRDGAADLTATVVTGAVDGRPRAARLRGFPTGLRPQSFRDAVSPDGRHYALAVWDGRVLVWDLATAGSGPRRLSGALPERGDVYSPHIDFSDDGSRLLYFLSFETPRPEDDGRTSLVRLWDTGTGRALPVPQRVVAQRKPVKAWLPGDGERIAVAGTRAKGEERFLDLYATSSGEHVRRVYGPRTAVNQEPADPYGGVWLDVNDGVRWYALVPGARMPSGSYGGGVTFRDLTGTHLYRDASSVPGETGAYRRVTIRDPRARDRFWSLTLPGRDGSRALGVVGQGTGRRTVLTVEGDTLLRSRAEPMAAVESELSSRPGDAAAVSPDGSRTARLRAGRLEVAGPGARSHHTALPKRAQQVDSWDVHLVWVTRRGADALLVWSDDSTDARLYDAETLRSRRVTWDCGRSGDPAANRPQDVVQTGDGDLVLLCFGDTLVRLDPRSGVQSGGPVRLEDTPVERGMFQDAGRLTARPGHPHQVAVITGPWRADGRIEVWDVRRGTRVARLEGGPLHASFLNGDAERWVVFTPDGDRLAAFDADRRVVWWDVDREHPRQPTRAVADATGFLGVAPDGTLAVAAAGVSLVSPDDAEPLGHLKDGGENLHAARIHGDTLHLATDKGTRALRLSPDAWHDTLCAALDGPNSAAQNGRPVLEAAKDTPPCPST